MKKTQRLIVCASLLLAALSIAAVAQAQSPFDGTWHINPSQAKFDPKPFTVYTSQGWYHCVSCTPPYDVQADGQAHPVTGQPFDTESVTVVDPHTTSFVDQKGGKTTTEATVTVSADGKLLTIKSKSYPMGGGAPQSSSLRLKRVGVLPAGVHATSGNWVPTGFTDTDADLTFTFKSNGDELTMTDPTGDSYTAKFDGGNYPFKGSYQTDAVSLKKIDAHTIEETDKHNGTVTNVSKMTVSANGKTMTMVSHDPQRDVTSTFVATKK
ncbi:MAG: hypothetical protein ABSD70_09015 [Terracidiphilus sp.]|jgi:hypothetical protein